MGMAPFAGVDGGRKAAVVDDTVVPMGVVTRMALGSSPVPHSMR